jgi:hypothetical protein
VFVNFECKHRREGRCSYTERCLRFISLENLNRAGIHVVIGQDGVSRTIGARIAQRYSAGLRAG